MRKLTTWILALALMIMPLAANAAETDVEAVRNLIEALPTVEEFQAMDEEAQLEAYNRTQAAYDAYEALSDEEKSQITDAEAVFESLFGHFNTLIAPAEEMAVEIPAPVEEQAESGNILIWIVLAAAVAAVALGLSKRKKTA